MLGSFDIFFSFKNMANIKIQIRNPICKIYVTIGNFVNLIGYQLQINSSIKKFQFLIIVCFIFINVYICVQLQSFCIAV